MSSVELRPLHGGWPLREAPRHFELGAILDPGAGDLPDFAVRQALGHARAGWWECDLSDNSLTWTSGVYDIFGLAQGTRVTREDAVALYCEESRATLERLRSYSIANGQAFVLDAIVRPANGEPQRWMRIIGAPVIEQAPVRLHGLKLRL